jgi:ABC-type transport system substrate-binding protein
MRISKWGWHSFLSCATSPFTRMSTPSVALIAALSMIALAGCGGSKAGPATVEVTGTVTLDGTPVDAASVLFSPEIGSGDGRLASQAMTDDEGRFKLSTHVGAGKYKPGIVPGKYVVTISKLDTAAAKNTFSPPKNLLPPKYADPKTSTLTAEVAAGQANDFPFPLKNN